MSKKGSRKFPMTAAQIQHPVSQISIKLFTLENLKIFIAEPKASIDSPSFWVISQSLTARAGDREAGSRASPGVSDSFSLEPIAVSAVCSKMAQIGTI